MADIDLFVFKAHLCQGKSW